MTARNRSIDAFRGLAIVLMVFFTVILKLSDELPDIIRHNSRGSFHFGDVVLPLFLFASGMSLVYFLEKHGRDERKTGERFLKLAFVGLLLSSWSTRGFSQMDEVMLSAFLFLGCVLLSGMNEKMMMVLIILIDLSYAVVLQMGWDSVFKDYYLGGYYAIPFYLPVMLAGYVVGKNTTQGDLMTSANRRMFFLFTLLFLISWYIAPIDKLEATPSFMMLSILISIVVLGVILMVLEIIPDLGELEYLGRKPFRYWIMMYVLFIIPLKEWAWYTETRLPLDLSWPVAVLSSIVLLIALWMLSKLLDAFEQKFEL